jgi:hypothetical protein
LVLSKDKPGGDLKLIARKEDITSEKKYVVIPIYVK